MLKQVSRFFGYSFFEYETITNMEGIMKKRFLLVVIIAGFVISMAASVQASTLLNFGFSERVGALDWIPGTALALGGQTQEALVGGQSVPLLYHASLGSYLNSDGAAIMGTGLGTDYEITATISFYEFVNTPVIGGPATFSLDTSLPAIVNIYQDSSLNSNALAGTGYADGTNVLNANIVDTGFISVFSSNALSYDLNNPTLLDGANDDDWSGQQSVFGAGSTRLEADVISYDNTWIIDAIDVLTFVLTNNTNNNLPFSEIDPSQMMFDGTVTNTGILGTVNGGIPSWVQIGFDPEGNEIFGPGGDSILFQADASSSFEGDVVPEPATLTLLGLGLLGVAAVSRRRIF